MISFPKDQVLANCQKYGPLLVLPENLDGARVMAAIATIESSLGENCGPRFEESYMLGHNVSPEQQKLNDQYGSDAACSYGPWQLMFINCGGYTPQELNANLAYCARAFVTHFNNYVIRAKGAKTVEEIGMVWNGGHIFPKDVPAPVWHYCVELERAYGSVTLPDGANV